MNVKEIEANLEAGAVGRMSTPGEAMMLSQCISLRRIGDALGAIVQMQTVDGLDIMVSGDQPTAPDTRIADALERIADSFETPAEPAATAG